MDTIYKETIQCVLSTFSNRVTKEYTFLSLKDGELYCNEIDEETHMDQTYDVIADDITILYKIHIHRDVEEDDDSVSISVSYVPNRFTDDTYYEDEHKIFGGKNLIFTSVDVNSVVDNAIDKLLIYLKKDIFIKHLCKLHN